jgi:hypothetical protein
MRWQFGLRSNAVTHHRTKYPRFRGDSPTLPALTAGWAEMSLNLRGSCDPMLQQQVSEDMKSRLNANNPLITWLPRC